MKHLRLLLIMWWENYNTGFRKTTGERVYEDMANVDHPMLSRRMRKLSGFINIWDSATNIVPSCSVWQQITRACIKILLRFKKWVAHGSFALCFGRRSHEQPTTCSLHGHHEMAPSVSVNFISLVTSCVGLWEEEPQTAHPMPFTWASHIATILLTGRWTLPSQSIFTWTSYIATSELIGC